MVGVHVLHQGAPAQHVDHMEPAAHRESRHAPCKAVRRERQVSLVLQRVHVVHLGMDLGLAVERRIHISAAAQKHTVEALEARSPVHAVGGGGSQKRHRIRTGEPERLQQCACRDDPRIAGRGSVLSEAPHERDAWSSHRSRLVARMHG